MADDEILKIALKGKEDALAQQLLMKRVATKKVEEAERLEGEGGQPLVVVSATYGYASAPLQDSLDVTVPLQFFTQPAAGSLALPAGSKNSLLGFYHFGADLRNSKRKKRRSVLEAFLDDSDDDDDDAEAGADTSYSVGAAGLRRSAEQQQEVRLFVRYKFGGSLWEAAFEDEEEVALPCPDRATRVGDADVVS
jgi:hypothetical protein